MNKVDNRNHKLNWTLDKVLMGILVFLAIKSYNSIDAAVQKVNQLEVRTAVIEFHIAQIELKQNQK